MSPLGAAQPLRKTMAFLLVGTVLLETCTTRPIAMTHAATMIKSTTRSKQGSQLKRRAVVRRPSSVPIAARQNVAGSLRIYARGSKGNIQTRAGERA